MKMRGRELFFMVCPVAIVLLYLGCEGAYDIGDALYYIPLAIINGLMILSAYLAWRSYTKEKVPVTAGILLSGIVVILPFAEEALIWSDRIEMVFEFAWFLWPILITCLSSHLARKIVKNKKIVSGMNTFLVLFLAVLFHWLAESTAGENVYSDLCVPAAWLAESFLWTFVLNYAEREEYRKRNLMAAWLVCLLVFGCLTFAHISYLSSPDMWGIVRNDWNRVIFLCWPVLLLFITKRLESLITEDRLYCVQKRGILYFLPVLLLIYVITNNELNFAVGSFKYDLGRVFYCLFLADIIFWDKLCVKQKQAGCRIKMSAFMAVVNVGTFIFLLIENERLREILSCVGRLFSGGRRPAFKPDWIEYRKTAFGAFILNDLTILDSEYGKERYLYSVYGHGLASIRFRFGMLPLLAMVLLLFFLVFLLWNWNRQNISLNQCARYLAVGCLLKMSVSCILQAGMVISPYMEFPFTGLDIAEIMLPILLCCEASDWKTKQCSS